MLKWLQNDMFACGQAGLPGQIICDARQWQLAAVFKHDFFACTGKYRCQQTPEQVVLKINRLQPFMGLPCAWIGRFLRNREMTILHQLDDIDQVPQIIKTYGRNGLIYRYIEGLSLDEKPDLPDDFFDQLGTLLQKFHQRKVCYIDMNKRGNILKGQDGRPYIIDFQISLHLPAAWCGSLCRALQREDAYHLLKHKRKLRPDLLTPEETMYCRKKSLLIRIHRTVALPYRYARRALMRFLFKIRVLSPDSASDRSPENNPRRFLR